MTGSVKSSVAEQVKMARKQAGMTQETSADIVGTKKSNISRLESGRYNPSFEFLSRIAQGLGKELEVRIR